MIGQVSAHQNGLKDHLLLTWAGIDQGVGDGEEG
jgi:hypothetical protein